jgi:hypothetical protein
VSGTLLAPELGAQQPNEVNPGLHLPISNNLWVIIKNKPMRKEPRKQRAAIEQVAKAATAAAGKSWSRRKEDATDGTLSRAVLTFVSSSLDETYAGKYMRIRVAGPCLA